MIHRKKFFKTALVKSGYGDSYKKKNIVTEDNTYPTGPSYFDGEIYMALGCNGFLNVKMKEILPAEEAMNYYLELAGFDIELQAQTIVVWQTEEGKYCYKVFFQQEYQGVPIVNILNRHSEIEDNYTYRIGGECYITGKTAKDVVHLTVQEGVLQQYNAKSIDRIISLSDAVGLLNTLLSSYRRYNVKDVVLEYMLMSDGNLQVDNLEAVAEEEEIHRESAPWATTCSYDINQMLLLRF